jgi:uncharacterized membrane protein
MNENLPSGHHHGFEEAFDVPDRTRRLLYVAAGVLALLTVAGMVILRPTGSGRPDLTGIGFGGEFYDARIVDLERIPCPGQGEGDIKCARAEFELLGGPDQGETVSQELFDLDASPPLDEGNKVVLRHDERAEDDFAYQFSGDRQRKPVLFWLAALFAVTVVVLGRLRGLAALAGLVASLGVLLVFVLPAIIDGRSPLLVAVVGASAIAYLALYLAHGFSPMTTVALLGTLAALLLTAVLGLIFVDLAAFSGLANEESFFLTVGEVDIDLKGLVLAGVVIGALGAIDDMTVTQASAVWELHAADPSMGPSRLYRSAMQIGRDHVASTVNTLVLAYAGASLPLLILFVLSTQSLGTVANSEIVATEIVRTLVGSIGLVAAVPITTWLAAVVAPDESAPSSRRSTRSRRRPTRARPSGSERGSERDDLGEPRGH